MNKTFTKLFIALIAMFVFALSANAEDTSYTAVDPVAGKPYYLYCPTSGYFLVPANKEDVKKQKDEPSIAWYIDDKGLYANIDNNKVYLVIIKADWDFRFVSMDGFNCSGYTQYYPTIAKVENSDYYTFAYDGWYVRGDAGLQNQDNDFSKLIFVAAPQEETSVLTLNEDATSEPTILTDDATDVKVKRTMTSGKWNTLCLPFSLTAAEVIANFGSTAKVMKMTAITAEGEVMFEDATTIEACQMYIVDPTTDVTEIMAEGKEGICTAITSTVLGKGTFVKFVDSSSNTYFVNSVAYTMKTEAEQTKYYTMYALINNKFYHVDNAITVKGFRWYIMVTMNSGNGAKGLTLNLNGEKTAISEIADADSMANGTCFNIAGQRVNSNAKGIVIVNGKKIINK